MKLLMLVLAAVVLVAPPAHAQVGPNGFRALVRVDIRATPAKVFDGFTQIGQWWSPSHTYSGKAENLSLDAGPGGCFCERLPDGGGVEHLRVVYVAPGEMLRMTGALGPLQVFGVAGTFVVTLKPTLGGTSLELTYAVGGFSEGGFNQIAPAVTTVLTEQMDRLKMFIETGRPSR